jgi:two-component system CheB/CheR fusion protein
LDTAKEELQSTNEELNTVNEELHGRNDELSRVNSDLLNLVGSVQIAIVMVSTDLRIRRFTPMAEKVLNLIPADLDRSIGHINPNIDCPNLDQLIAECIDSVSSLEREVQDRQGRWYSLRIRPYKTVDNKIEGAVLALFDIDQAKQSELRVRLASQYVDAILESTSQPFVMLDPELRIRGANNAFYRTFGVAAGDLDGRLLDEVGGTWDLAALRGAVAGLDGDSFSVDALPARFSPHNGAPRHLSVAGRVLRSLDAPNTRLLLLGFADGVAPKSP